MIKSNINRRNGVMISVRNLNRPDKGKLDNISLDIMPGEMVAIIGGSGAGKTTLLDAISGYSKVGKSRVFYSGMDISKHPEYLKKAVGYVPQSDIVHMNLTVYEMLNYTARLRLSQDFSKIKRLSRVDEALKMTKLKEHANTTVRKLSGGQRKRASIAMELLADPTVLFLDEPTSGLDHNTEEELINSLREIADTYSKTMVLVTHTTDFLAKFDKVIILGKDGKLCYFGHADNITAYFDVESIPDVYKKLEVLEEAEHWKKKYNDRRPQLKVLPKCNIEEVEAVEISGAAWGTQLRALTSRYAKLTLTRFLESKLKFSSLWLLPLIFGVVLGFIVGEKLYKEFSVTQVVSLIMACFGMWIGLFTGITQVSVERSILRREGKANMKISAYITSKVIVLSVVSVVQTMLLFFIYWFMCTISSTNMPTRHLTGLLPWPENWVTVELVCLSSITLGLCLSSFSRNPEGIAPYVLMLQIILPGVLLVLPEILDKMKIISCTYWGNRALCASADINEIGWLSAYNQFGDRIASEVFKRRDDYIPELSNLLDCWKNLAIIFIAPIFLSLIGLKLIVINNER